MRLPAVVVVGRPNVGKSTLFNRITGVRRSIVAPVAGTTRDALEAPSEWRRHRFRLVDTGGLFGATSDPLHELVVRHGLRALEGADLVVLVVDGQEGLVPGDEQIAQRIRALNVPVVLAVNKTDDHEARRRAGEFHRLGIDPVVEVSAEHGDGVFELLDEVVARLGSATRAEATEETEGTEDTEETEGTEKSASEADTETSVAIVGRPNVGKSTLFNKLVQASKENRAKAESFIEDLKPIGGTAIDDALRKALAVTAEKRDRPCVIIFLTDGLPTVGVTSEDQIVANVKKGTAGNSRIFCFGIGSDVNTHLLDRITEETKAFSQYVLPEEDLEIKVSSFFTKIKQPVLANLKITFPEGVRATKVYPAPLPDLFKGQQLLLTGRYRGTDDGKLMIEGTANDAAREFRYDAKFPEEATEHDFIPRLWATRRIGYLLDEIRLQGENKELKDEATELARKFGIVTPYTAYLIVEDEAKRNIPEMTQ
jgi:small GTP-binding protein